jgi:hypothetical protein
MTRRATFTFPKETEADRAARDRPLAQEIGLRRTVETVDDHGAAFR